MNVYKNLKIKARQRRAKQKAANKQLKCDWFPIPINLEFHDYRTVFRNPHAQF